MGIDVNTIIESTEAKLGLSVTFIIAAILLLLSNLGIEIKFAKLSINNIIGTDYIAGVQIYIIIALLSFAYTIIRREVLTKPTVIEDDPTSVICHNCSSSMEISERKCVECGSVFSYKNEHK